MSLKWGKTISILVYETKSNSIFMGIVWTRRTPNVSKRSVVDRSEEHGNRRDNEEGAHNELSDWLSRDICERRPLATGISTARSADEHMQICIRYANATRNSWFGNNNSNNNNNDNQKRPDERLSGSVLGRFLSVSNRIEFFLFLLRWPSQFPETSFGCVFLPSFYRVSLPFSTGSLTTNSLPSFSPQVSKAKKNANSLSDVLLMKASRSTRTNSRVFLCFVLFCFVFFNRIFSFSTWTWPRVSY